MDEVQNFKCQKKLLSKYFEADKIIIQFSLASLLSKRLILINSLNVEKPTFYLDIVEKIVKTKIIKNKLFMKTI